MTTRNSESFGDDFDKIGEEELAKSCAVDIMRSCIRNEGIEVILLDLADEITKLKIEVAELKNGKR